MNAFSVIEIKIYLICVMTGHDFAMSQTNKKRVNVDREEEK